MDLKCHNCGMIVMVADEDQLPKMYVCRRCGAVNDLPIDYAMATDTPLPCLEPTGFEWQMPAGKIGNDIVGCQFISSTGQKLARWEWIQTFGFDPVTALKYEREHRGLKIGEEAVR
jgi:hypothetical protein